MPRSRKTQFGRQALAVTAAAAAMWVAAGFWHNDLGPSAFGGAGHAPLTAKALGMTLLAYAIVATAMTRVYANLPYERRRWLAGLRIGLWGGALWAFPHAMLTSAGLGEPIMPAIVHSLGHLVEGGIAGLVMHVAYHLGNGGGRAKGLVAVGGTSEAGRD